MKEKIEVLMEKRYDEEISKENFLSEMNNIISDKKFNKWVLENLDFGSIEPKLDEAVKHYKRSNEIDNCAEFLNTL